MRRTDVVSELRLWSVTESRVANLSLLDAVSFNDVTLSTMENMAFQ